jgi:hypothetical protein
MPRYTYRGDAPVLFSHYLDVTDPDKPKTLDAKPGETYDIRQAEGYEAIQPDGQFTDLELPMPPDADWETVGQAKATAKPKAQADKDSKENG